MVYKITADIVVVIHLLWIMFLVFGAMVGRYIAWVKWLHVGGLAFSLFLQVFSWYCPLTHMEVWLRARHDPTLTYIGSFIAHYAEQLVYLEVSKEMVLVGTVCVVLFSIWLYQKH